MSARPAKKLRLSLDSVLRRVHRNVALIAVLAAGLSMTAVALLALRVYADQNLRLVARSMSYTVEAAVVFNDAYAAREALAMIGVNEDIDQAEVLNKNGILLAQWARGQHGPRYYVERTLTGWMLPQALVFPITHDEQQIGSIRLVPHSRSLLPFLLSGLSCLLACLILSLVVATRLSRRMEAQITSPLRQLAETAHRVRRERSFGLRVPEARISELNQLNDDFNALLDELEAWQSHLQKENASLSHRANHDSLTGLSNRAFLEAELERTVSDARIAQGKMAVLFLDSDRFKQINDTFGHAAGDRVLVTIAARIRQQLREGDLVARLGGDEFAILLKPLRHSGDAVHIADNIINAMTQPIELPGGNSIVSSLTIGVAVYPDHASDAAALVAAADDAMYRAKQAQRGTRQVAHAASFSTTIRSDHANLPQQRRRVTLGLCMLALLAACQSAPVSKSPFNTAQVAALTEQGFRQTDDGWELSFTDKLLFDFNVSNLTSSSRMAIRKISAALLKVEITHMQIEGHTDNAGDQAYNNKLSLARANVVADAMASAGVPRANLVVRGLGMSKPVASNATKDGQAENRRVSIIVSAP